LQVFPSSLKPSMLWITLGLPAWWWRAH
jgi:hypothetical protein